MVRYALFILVFLPMAVQAAVDYKDDDFSIKLGSDWVHVSCDEKDHVAFMSKAQDISIKISSVSFHFDPAKFELAPKKTIEFFLKSERDKNPNGAVTIVDYSVSTINGGYSATYSGHDNKGRSFKWIGFFHKEQFIYLYLETPIRLESNLEPTAKVALQNFRYASVW